VANVSVSASRATVTTVLEAFDKSIPSDRAGPSQVWTSPWTI
jgi:hypothetical protein